MLNKARQSANDRPGYHDRDLAIALINYGYGLFLIRNFENAFEQYNQANTLLRKLDNEYPLVFKRELSALLTNLHTYYMHFNRLGEAEKNCVENLKITEALAATGANEFKPKLADAYNNLADVYDKNKDFSNAEYFYLKAIAIFKELGVKYPLIYLSKLADTQLYLAMHYHLAGNMTKSEETYLETQLTFNHNFEFPGVQQNANYAIFLLNFGINQYYQKKFEKAAPLMEKALELYREFSLKSPKRYEDDLTHTLFNLSLVYAKLNKTNDLQKALSEMFEIQFKILTYDNRYWQKMVVRYALLAELFTEENQIDKSLVFLAKQTAISEFFNEDQVAMGKFYNYLDYFIDHHRIDSFHFNKMIDNELSLIKDRANLLN